ncbi:MFS transporter [Komagataeibacter saccharivorans]|uniref:MFS transporter n=1 Tax=Komagataeibacter saccharivorans TaxID=265959 RepID=UPI002155A04B|nr:MFS transporter [Komagataeibacter saccharivorans]
MTRQTGTPAARQNYSPMIALIMAATSFMQNLDGAIINTSLPQMAHSFGVTTIDLSMGITAYMLASAALSPLSGWLSQKIGERTLLLVSVIAFTLASVWCGIAPDLTMFVLARIAQGLAGAMMMPVGMSVVLRHTPKSEWMRAQAVTVWPGLMAPIIGPVLGGFITQTLDWRWNFWLNLPIGLAGAIAILRFVPQEEKTEPPPMDFVGFSLCAIGLTTLLAGFQRSAESGRTREIALGLIIGGIATGWAAIRHLRRHPTPILSLAPLNRPSLRYVVLYPGVLFRTLFSAMPFLLPLLFQLGFGLRPAAAGGWVLVYFCSNLGLKPFTSTIIRRFGFRNILLFNGLMVALSLVACGFAAPDTNRGLLVLMLVFAGATRSMQLTSLSTVAFADISTDERRAASGLLSILQQAASAAGVAGAAFGLSLFQTIDHSHGVGLAELHATFFAAAIIALVAALGCIRMPRTLGQEVSGHRA